MALHKRGPHAIRLSAPPRKSDVMVCSPLGLLEAMAAKPDLADCLSSVHTVMLDSIDYVMDRQFLMLRKALEALF